MAEFRHGDILKPSQPDDVFLAEAVEKRFLAVCDLYVRVRGMSLPIPPSLDPDIFRWRQMRVRHKRGDLRHTEAEMKSTKVLAQWTLDVNCELRNQPRKVLEWKD